MKISFLHTAQVHVDTFDALVDALAPDAICAHHVAPNLLIRAQTHGLENVADETTGILSDLAGADAVVCTCSTLGPLADAMSAVHPNVIRVDRPLMETACATGTNILVAICLESTQEATLELLQECAAQQQKTITPQLVLCDIAWPFFENGDQDGFAAAIVTAVHAEIATFGKPDCIVLAQASMRVAAEALGDLGIPVMSSPHLATKRAIEVATSSIESLIT